MRDEPRTAEAPEAMDSAAESTRTASGEVAGSPEVVVAAARAASRLGRYQLVLPLAQGGMGVVFAARLLGSHGVERLVAIKTLRPITSKSDRAALLREAKLTARLHHRNVVATIDLGEVDDVPYVVMELVDGVPLSRLLSAKAHAGEKLAPELGAWIVMQAALGLHAAHELCDTQDRPLGLVHRDISPQNILLSLDGEVKIADFGIAKFAGREESTATGMIKGKFAYMSPEQASDTELDRRSDLFALGIVLWEVLTGTKLFASDTPARTIMRVLELEIRPPRDVRPEVGEELSSIAMRCLARDPNARPPTAAAVADALRVALRARGAPVDEADLSSVVTSLFGEERASFMDRLRNEAPDDLTTVKETPPGEASGLAAMSVSSGSRPVVPLKRSPALAGVLAIALAGVIGVVAWRVSVGSGGPAVEPSGRTAAGGAATTMGAPSVEGPTVATGRAIATTTTPATTATMAAPATTIAPATTTATTATTAATAPSVATTTTANGRAAGAVRAPVKRPTATGATAKPGAGATTGAGAGAATGAGAGAKPAPAPAPTAPQGGKPFDSL